MARIQQQQAKKIGLIAAISMLIGSTIGVGIFFKNNNVFDANNNNSIGVLIAWIISGLISICTAFCFAEVGSSKQSEAGLGGWFETLVGKRSGRFVKIIQPIFYFLIIAFAIAIFCGEAIFNIFHYSEKVNFGIIIFVGILIFCLFLVLNLISINVSAKLQVVISFMKFIPLLLVIFGGIIFGSVHSSDNLFIQNHENTSTIDDNISFIGIIISIPSILFAFDSFIGVGNLSNEMKNPQKNVPLAIIIGMIIVTVFYLLVTIGQIMVGQGNIYDVFNVIFFNNPQAQDIMYIIISILLLVSIFGVLNAFSLIVMKNFQANSDENLILFNKQFKSFANKIISNRYENREGFIIAICYLLLIGIIVLIPSAILNTDALVDGVSNFPTTFFFSLYGTVILAGLINRKKEKVSVQKVKGFIPMAIIAIIGCYFVTGFQVSYTFFIRTIIDPYQTLSWGLFSTNNFITYNWIGTLMMFLYISLMIIYYLITNNGLKKVNNHHKNLKSTNKNIRIWKEDYD